MAVVADTAILEAALDQFASTGISRTSTDDIARRAGVNRATVYRRFGTRERLVAAAYLHEAGRVLEDLTARVPDVPTAPDPSFDAAANVALMFDVAVETMRENRLVQRMLETDREAVLVGLTAAGGDVLGFAADVLAQRISDLHAWRGTEPPGDPRALGTAVARLVHSCVLTPGPATDLRGVVVSLVLGN
jgi:AcrR family transcriptional regulator